MSKWWLYGGPLDGLDFEIPAGRPLEIPRTIRTKILVAQGVACSDAAAAALRAGGTLQEVDKAYRSAHFTYEIEDDLAVAGRFIYTPTSTDPQEAS